MSDDFWGGIVIATVFIGGAWYWNKDPAPAPLQPGRYQIALENKEQPFLIDTATGNTWRWVYMPSNYKMGQYGQPEIVGRYWEKTDRFEDGHEEMEHFKKLRDLDKLLYEDKGKPK
jgi:uncharacterized protein YqcC (DUF446 family)